MNRSPLARQIPVNSPENERQACFPCDTLDSRRRTRIFQRTVEEGGSREEKRDATEKEKKKKNRRMRNEQSQAPSRDSFCLLYMTARTASFNYASRKESFANSSRSLSPSSLASAWWRIRKRTKRGWLWRVAGRNHDCEEENGKKRRRGGHPGPGEACGLGLLMGRAWHLAK